MKTQAKSTLKIAKWSYFAASVLFIVLGILFMTFPETALSLMVKLSGIIMMVFGFIKLSGYFSKGLYRGAFQFELELGITLIVLGFAVLLKPKGAVSFFCIALGISVLIDGLLKMRLSLEAKSFGVSGWWITFAASVFAAVIGLVLVLRPSSSADVIMEIIGLSLIIDGILNLCVAFSASKIINAHNEDVIEVEDFEIEE